MSTIAFLGMGAMGTRVVRHFIAAGYDVRVWNRSAQGLAAIKQAGAVISPSPSAAASDAELVFVMVRDDAASKAVWLGDNGAAQALGRGAVAIDMSTLSPDWVKELAQAIAGTPAEFLEAPVLGTRPQAEAAKLIFLIGGERSVLDKARPVLQLAAGAIHHIGDHGKAAAMKLAINTQYATQVAIWAETLALLERQHIPMSEAVEILNSLPTTAPALQMAGKLMAERQYAPMFPIDLVEKDLSYAENLAQASGLTTAVIKGVRGAYTNAQQQGHGSDNIIAVLANYLD